uniref:Uncharacterized protein n=1 Tax=Arundo donax TaxID=35708 RepID=A0A0A9CGX8_ARUDO
MHVLGRNSSVQSAASCSRTKAFLLNHCSPDS